MSTNGIYKWAVDKDWRNLSLPGMGVMVILRACFSGSWHIMQNAPGKRQKLLPMWPQIERRRTQVSIAISSAEG